LFPAGGLTPARRIRMLQRAKAADIVFIQKKLFHPIFLPVLKAANPNIVFDFDDAAFAREPYNPKPRGMSPGSSSSVGRIKAVLKKARAVVAGNSFLASYAREYNENVYELPTPVDTGEGLAEGRFKADASVLSVEGAGSPRVKSAGGPHETETGGPINPGSHAVTIGWLGTSKNLYYLNGLTDPLKQVIGQCPTTRLSVISNGKFEPADLPVENLPWSPDAESEWLNSIDVGIMPLEHDDWSRGKCAFKLLQYMAAGLPTVSSPVGMNVEVIQDGANGYLADTEEEWREKLLALVREPRLRHDLGSSGLRTVEQKYSLSVCLKRLKEILGSTLD
jgi:hypothetical protein